MALRVPVSKRLHQVTEAIKSNLHPNFYRLHLSYFIVVILIFSAVLHGSNAQGFSLRYPDALFLATSALCGVGLNTVDLGILDGFQQAVIFILMLLGDLTIITLSVVWIRRYFFRRKLNDLLQHSRAAERIRNDIEHDQSQSSTYDNGSTPSQTQPRERLKRSSQPGSDSRQSQLSDDAWTKEWHNYGYGGFPTPWSAQWFRSLGQHWRRKDKPLPFEHHYLSFEPNLDHRGRFQNLTSSEEAELGGVEYRALVLLTWLLPLYAFLWIGLVMVILVPYAMHSHVAKIVRDAQPGSLSPAWWAVFTTVSGYTNTGLTVLNESFIPLADQYSVLVLAGTVVLAGNAFYPVFLRLFIWTISKVISRQSRMHHSCSFLLHHPRRCYLFLFPSRNTWILFLVQTGITLTSWVLWIILQLHYGPITHHFPPGQRTMDGLFQSIGLRASGFYIIVIDNIAPALQIFYLVVMYVSVFPILLSIRSSNIYEERSLGQTSSSAQGSRDQHQSGGLGLHIRNQLAYDLWWLLAAIFLICIIERDSLTTPNPGWTLYSVIFEVVSGYGTVGLSLGVSYANYSFCGT